MSSEIILIALEYVCLESCDLIIDQSKPLGWVFKIFFFTCLSRLQIRQMQAFITRDMGLTVLQTLSLHLPFLISSTLSPANETFENTIFPSED